MIAQDQLAFNMRKSAKPDGFFALSATFLDFNVQGYSAHSLWFSSL